MRGTLVLHAGWSAANVDVAFDAAIDCAAHQRPARHCQRDHDTTRYDTRDARGPPGLSSTTPRRQKSPASASSCIDLDVVGEATRYIFVTEVSPQRNSRISMIRIINQ